MRRSLVALALIVVFAACGDDTATTTVTPATPVTTAATATTAAPTTSAAPTTTDAPAGPAAPLPDTPVHAPITDGYVFGSASGTATDSDLPFALGSISARWYTVGDRWVVVYDGLDLDQTGPLCPGNSILSSASNMFESVSNSPTPGAECVGAPTVVDDAVQVCDGRVVYLTEIPTGVAGILFASVEIYPGDGFNSGASGSFVTDGSGPAVDLAMLGC